MPPAVGWAGCPPRARQCHLGGQHNGKVHNFADLGRRRKLEGRGGGADIGTGDAEAGGPGPIREHAVGQGHDGAADLRADEVGSWQRAGEPRPVCEGF